MAYNKKKKVIPNTPAENLDPVQDSPNKEYQPSHNEIMIKAYEDGYDTAP